MADKIEQILCTKCEGMKTLIVNDKVISAEDWMKHGMACDIGCICKYEVDSTKDKTELDGDPGKCPYCGSEDLDYHGPDVQDGMIFYDVDCCNDECNNDFKEWYTLTFDTLYGHQLKNKEVK